MTLKESIKTAVVKIENSYKGYEWILKNKDLIKKDDDDYKKHFSEAQQVFSAVDILLRCFLIEKKIPVDKKGKKIFIAEGSDEEQFNTHEMCCAILAYNKDNPEQQCLTDVDFSYFTGENKKARNLDEHLGTISALQDLYRVYYNLNIICDALNDTIFYLNLKANSKTFDYARFEGCMDEMCVDDRRGSVK